MALDPSTAYGRLIASVAELEGVKLHQEEAATMRAAADARLFGDDDVDVRMADVDVLFLRLELSGRLAGETIERLRQLLQDVCAASFPLAA